ncbi:MAG: YhcH/YjgK/YiaL family protein [Rikenellaceae bacterium]
MILGSIKNSERIEGLNPNFKMIFDYVKSKDFLKEPLGRIELDGDKIFVNNVVSELVPQEKQILEMHRKYLDIHIPLSKAERIGWKSVDDVKFISKEYNEETDLEFCDDKPTCYVDVLPGEFLIVYPEDCHAPIIGEGSLQKLIVKIYVE